MTKQKFSYVSIIGRTNAGKSSILNAIAHETISIVAPIMETTRENIFYIKTIEDNQIAYVDSPGFNICVKNAFKKSMSRHATTALYGEFFRETDYSKNDSIDSNTNLNIKNDFNSKHLICFVVEACKWTNVEDRIIKQLNAFNLKNIILVINKIDKISNADFLCSFIKNITDNKLNFINNICVSAKTNYNIANLEKMILSLLPYGKHVYPNCTKKIQNDIDFAKEIIREQLFNCLKQEIPYKIEIIIDNFKEEQSGIIFIYATLRARKKNYKSILIGKNGEFIKKISSLSRIKLEESFKKKIFLKIIVDVKEKILHQ